MAPVIPLIAAVAAYGTAAAVGFGVAGAIAGAVVATGISMIGSRLFAEKVDRPNFNFDAQGLSIATASSVETHRIIYGTAKVSGNESVKLTTNTGTRYNGSTKTGSNPFYHTMICLAGHEIEEITTVYFNNAALTLDGNGWVTSAPYFKDGASYARVLKHLGADDQTADTLALASIPNWDFTCRARGVAYLYVILEYNQDIYANGIPNISAIIKGKKVYDPRTETTAWSANATLCALDYLMADYGLRAPLEKINIPLAIESANICDESVNLQGGGTEARYECNGALDTSRSPLDNLEQLTSAVAAPITYVQGKFCLHAAAYNIPSIDITDDDLMFPLKINPRLTRKELFNAVKGTFVNPSADYQVTDFPIVENSTYKAQDGGVRIVKDVQLPMEKSSQRAQRLAKIVLEKARQGITIELALNMRGLQIAVWDTFRRTDAILGWEDKVFRVLKWELDGERGIVIQAQEESSESYEWNEGEATVIDPAPDTNLPDPFSVQAPGVPMIAEALYSTIGSAGVKVRVAVSWMASNDAFVQFYQLEYKLDTDINYIVLPRTQDTSFTIFDFSPGTYDFRVKAINSLGVSSNYSSASASIAGLTALPLDIQNFSLNAINNNAHCSWNNITDVDLDVIVGGGIRIRYTPDIAAPTWSSAVDIGPLIPGSATYAALPLLTGTYLAKAVDSSGNESENAALIISTVADIVKMNAIETLTENPGFTGTKTNMSVSAGILSLSADGAGGYELSGEYEFSDYIDIGKVTTSRVTAGIAALVYDSTATFDERTGLFDDQDGYFDGEQVSKVSAAFYISTTDDDPAVTPTWTDYRRFFVGDYTCRAYRAKLIVESQNSSYNIDISELSLNVDCPDVSDAGNLTTSGSGRTTVSFGKVFVLTTPYVGATIHDAATGDYFDIANITSANFEIGVKNAAGSFVVRNIKWEAKGY